MATFNYPPKPWSPNQIAELIPGVNFFWSAEFRKWAPVSIDGVVDYGGEGISSENSLTNDQLTTRVEQLQSGIDSKPNIWKLQDTPSNPAAVDILYQIDEGVLYSYHEEFDTWVQIV